jgi:hypothetical protein
VKLKLMPPEVLHPFLTICFLILPEHGKEGRLRTFTYTYTGLQRLLCWWTLARDDNPW